MLQRAGESSKIDLDERGNPLMTIRTLTYFCEKEGLFSTPELNEKLYLQYKGFLKMDPETLALYSGLIALWLNNNAITQIQGLDTLLGLTSLALNNNSIARIEGLTALQNLRILNLSYNKIELVCGLGALRKLETLNLAHNFLTAPRALSGIAACPALSTLDLSENELENTEQIFEEVVMNQRLGCLYLKATPLSRGFRNYRKRLIAALPILKFLDDRPVLQQDHRLATAWIQGGLDYERQERQKLAEEKTYKQQQEKQNRVKAEQDRRNEQSKKNKPQGFIASVQQTSLRIMNIQDEQEEARIISKYFQAEQEQVQRNKQRLEQQQQQEQARLDYYTAHETEVIAEKVNEILGRGEDIGVVAEGTKKAISNKWKSKYESILETLLLRYKFDFSEVQPSFNMILADINKKLLRSPIRFEISQLRQIWTQIELKKRSQARQ